MKYANGDMAECESAVNEASASLEAAASQMAKVGFELIAADNREQLARTSLQLTKAAVRMRLIEGSDKKPTEATLDAMVADDENVRLESDDVARFAREAAAAKVVRDVVLFYVSRKYPAVAEKN